MPNEAKLTNEEAIENVIKNGATYIAVQGTPDNKKVADMIADDCHANVAHGETQSIIECNSAVEQRFCMSDEDMEAACEEMSCRLRFSLLPENFEF